MSRFDPHGHLRAASAAAGSASIRRAEEKHSQDIRDKVSGFRDKLKPRYGETSMKSDHVIFRPDIKVSQKPKWKPWVLKDKDDKVIRMHTGRSYREGPGTSHLSEGEKWHQVDHFVFEATVQPDGVYRGDSAAGMYSMIEGMPRVQMNTSSADKLFKCILTGTHTPSKDRKGFTGLWTMVKRGQNTFIAPYVVEA